MKQKTASVKTNIVANIQIKDSQTHKVTAFKSAIENFLIENVTEKLHLLDSSNIESLEEGTSFWGHRNENSVKDMHYKDV